MPTLVLLFRAHLKYHAALDPRYEPPSDTRLTEFFRQRLREPETGILLAESKEGVRGYVLVQMRNSSPATSWWGQWLRRVRPGRLFPAWSTVGYIVDCFVVPPARRQGVGRQLVQEAVEWCRWRGAKEIELGVLPNNQPGRAFWEALGFVPCRIEMRRKILE